jgi:hypothetical protein
MKIHYLFCVLMFYSLFCFSKIQNSLSVVAYERGNLWNKNFVILFLNLIGIIDAFLIAHK